MKDFFIFGIHKTQMIMKKIASISQIQKIYSIWHLVNLKQLQWQFILLNRVVAMSKTIIAIQNDTIDTICWREYGRSAGVVEMVLEANPSIIDHGVFIPMGTEVILPDIETPQQTKQTIQLWD